MTGAASPDLRLVGFEELSATQLRTRLLARLDEFWAGSALPLDEAAALHDPLFFHQFGGFGALALTAADEDAGYLLGAVGADRLAVVHALAVQPSFRRAGVARALLHRFARLATAAGARAVQAVIRPDDDAAAGLAARSGAVPARSPDHAGPGRDRIMLTRLLPVE